MPLQIIDILKFCCGRNRKRKPSTPVKPQPPSEAAETQRRSKESIELDHCRKANERVRKLQMKQPDDSAHNKSLTEHDDTLSGIQSVETVDANGVDSTDTLVYPDDETFKRLFPEETPEQIAAFEVKLARLHAKQVEAGIVPVELSNLTVAMAQVSPEDMDRLSPDLNTPPVGEKIDESPKHRYPVPTKSKVPFEPLPGGAVFCRRNGKATNAKSVITTQAVQRRPGDQSPEEYGDDPSPELGPSPERSPSPDVYETFPTPRRERSYSVSSQEEFSTDQPRRPRYRRSPRIPEEYLPISRLCMIYSAGLLEKPVLRMLRDDTMMLIQMELFEAGEYASLKGRDADAKLSRRAADMFNVRLDNGRDWGLTLQWLAQLLEEASVMTITERE
ncbi:hypothetical protein EDC01DRAFT_626570 [Geopyxis carbonaria]|nr:hypothetical protein EDC01DRAFT_626570 [Geopyxis carbonaria]